MPIADTPNVSYVRPELAAMLPSYEQIQDCVKGELAVKAAKTKYLPKPNAADTSIANAKRYDSYVTRAVFYNVTKRTLNGLTGQIYLRDPVVEVPKLLETVTQNIDGAGVDIVQQSKETSKLAIGYGRAGLFIDYPSQPEPVSLKALQDGDIRPTVFVYEPWKIKNWRTVVRGAKELLSLVVLEEDVESQDDGFMLTTQKQYRVLRLSSTSVYYQEIWYENVEPTTKKKAYQLKSTLYPLDANGKPMNEIPFTFVGSENNSSRIDEAPLYDISSLNISHYRNSADYEESAFIVGQPTPVFSGLTEDWVKNVLKDKVMLGSRAAIPLPEGGAATLLQASENSMPYEAMKHKEGQMIALGAKIIEEKTIEKTATEVIDDSTTATSTLATTAKNVSAAYEYALKWCARFVGADENSIKFKLHNDFTLTKLTAEERRQLIAEWQGGLITFSEAREVLRRGDIATLTDKEAKDTIKEELADIPGLQVNVDNNVKKPPSSTTKSGANTKPKPKPAAKNAKQ